MTDIPSEHRIALLDGCSGDHQVVKRQHVSFSRLLAFDLTNEPRRALSRGMNWNQVD
jgi:hypothetical protein